MHALDVLDMLLNITDYFLSNENIHTSKCLLLHSNNPTAII